MAGCGISDRGAPDALEPAAASGLDARPDNLTCLAPDRAPPAALTARLLRAFPALSFDRPVHAVQAPGDRSRWFVVERQGRVRAFENSESAAASGLFVDVSARLGAADRAALLGLAFDPGFADNGRAFVLYARAAESLQAVLASFASRDGGATLDPATERVLLTVDLPSADGIGGHLAFGRDRMLYVSVADGSSGAPLPGNAQETRNLLGKIMRLDVTDGAAYAIPDGNRFAGNPPCTTGTGTSACPEIFAFGLRNPHRFSFDSATGVLWAGDAGRSHPQEVNRILSGGNYGWPIRAGWSCVGAAGCPTVSGGDSLLEPQVAYGAEPDSSIIGGLVYRGPQAPALQGHYIFADAATGELYAYAPETWAAPVPLVDSSLSINSIAGDLDGELFVVDDGGGLYRLDASASAGSAAVPDLLSETGCMDPANPTRPAAGLIPFRINSPLWSDGAGKDRWIALPNGLGIAVGPDGDLQFPRGSVLVKNFSLGDQLVETRLLMHHPDGSWAGYTYEWTDDGRTATRVVGGKRRRFGAQDWVYPSESECLRCHTVAAGRTLGPEIAQLNGDFRYPQTGRMANQLITLDAIGVLQPPLGQAPGSLPAYADFTRGTGSVEERARALLHANCSGCHRPGGPTGSSMDLRHATPLAETQACDVRPARGDLGIADARLIAPGAPARSVLLARDGRRDAAGMPPLGSLIINEAGISLLREWIAGLTDCS